MQTAKVVTMPSGTKRPVRNLEDLAQAACEVARIAKRENVRVALVGGYALQLYGSDRLTGDVDVVAERLLDGLPPGPHLSFGGEQTEASNGVPVDFILRSDDYSSLYDEALDRADFMDDDVTGIEIVSPEYIAAMKLAAGRARDAADLEWLILSNVADMLKTRAIVKKHLGAYAAQELDRIVDEVRWKASKGKA